MNIAIVNNDFGLGGLQRVTTVIGESLGKNNEVFFYSLKGTENYYNINHNFIDGSTIFDTNKLFKQFIRGRRLFEKIKKKGEFIPINYVKRNIDKLIEFIDIHNINILILSGADVTSYIPYIKNQQPKVKIVAWQHSNAKTYFNNYAKSFQQEYFEGITAADAAVCLTIQDLNAYSKYNPNTQLIHNPLTIDHDKCSYLKEKNIAFVGRIEIENKGIDFLVELASKIPHDWTISIAGSGSKKNLLEFRKLIKQYNVADKIVFRGPLKGANLLKHYLDSSIYVMTSRWEGWGLVLIEAMSFGLPIIAFHNSGADEVLSGGKYGILVENGNVDELNKQVGTLINDREKLEYYQQKSLKRVKDFNLEFITLQWEMLLNNMVKTVG